MSKKLMLLALVAVSAAMFAVPAAASAAEWKLEPGSQTFTASSVGHTTLTTNVNETVTCSTSTGNGTVNAAGTGGAITLLFHGCVSSGTACTTPGQTSGTITAAGSWTSVYLTDDKTKPGIKIEGGSAGTHGELATFKCGFGLVTVTVHGSVIGEVEDKCGEEKTEFKIKFESTAHGVQKYTQNTATGVHTDLKVFRNDVERTGSQDGTGIIKLQKKSKLNCV